ncbi:hypothetical protein QYE76_004812 [Lolium multiflorum]|uniref:Retrotransposon gag domain-containing protein n=1 Tax=Lolium multiflorum TaxID=4521 RepID=A0AAD8W0K6_LOLMU|nr:hypothetical protein QYE76_004812 [Lolium multiflorum]
MGSFDDTIAVGRVLYVGNLPIVPPDECWIPAKTDPVKLSIVPVGGIHIFIGKPSIPTKPRSAWVSQVLEKQRCHFVHFLAHTAGTAPQEAGAGPEQVEVPENNAAPDQQEAVGESGAPVEESILGNLSPISGDATSMDTEEFDRKVKEYGYGDQPEVESAQPMQVLATVAPLEQQEREDENTTSDPGPSNAGSPLDRERPFEDVLSPEEIVAQARMDLVAKSDVLNKPITPGDAADPEALEATRKEMLATAKKFANTAAAILDEREEAAHLMDRFERQDREITATLEQVKSMRKEWEDQLRNPIEQQPLATPKDNMQKAAEILNKKDEEIDIDYVRKLVASAMQQQSKADTSRMLESNPDHCVSTAQKDARINRHPDDESRTGSTKRRRKAREHPNPIPVPSRRPRQIRRRERMQCTLVGTSTEIRHLHLTGTRVPRHLAAAVQPETPGPMGLVELTSATICRRQGPGRVRRNHAGTRTTIMIASRSPGGAGTRNVRQSLTGAGMTEGTITKVKVATEVGASLGKTAGIQKAEAKNLTGPLAGPARIWLSDLEKNSIFCWFDLKNAFEKHFRGTYKRPATTSDLQACIQKKGETSRNFLTRWLACRNECENVDNRTAMHAFIGGLQRGGLLRHKLTCLVNANKLTLDDMITIASDHTAADDDVGGDLAANPPPAKEEP